MAISEKKISNYVFSRQPAGQSSGGGGQNVPKSKASQGWPVGNNFWRPSENGL